MRSEIGPAAVYPSPARAPLAQSAERLHGKEKVRGSIPRGGSAGGTQAILRVPRRGEMRRSLIARTLAA